MTCPPQNIIQEKKIERIIHATMFFPGFQSKRGISRFLAVQSSEGLFRQKQTQESQQSCSLSGREYLFSYCSPKKKSFYLCNCLLAFCIVTGIITCSLPFPSLTESSVAFLLFVLMASKSLHLLSSLSTQSLGQKKKK